MALGDTEPARAGAPNGGQPALLGAPAEYWTELTDPSQDEPETHPAHCGLLHIAALCPVHDCPAWFPQTQPVQVRVSSTATINEWATGSSGGHATSALPPKAAQRRAKPPGGASQSQVVPEAQKTPGVWNFTGSGVLDAAHFPGVEVS